MPIGLTTGVPGAGKTLFTVSEVLPKYLAQTIAGKDGESKPRRLCIAGVVDLLLSHEPIAVAEFDPETYVDVYRACDRKPGEPPITHLVADQAGTFSPATADDPRAVPLVQSAENWWLWCQPGDVIVVDECQRLFRPMPAGRRIPRFIAKLETHRHFGVDFELITQHPQLLHVNVRNLVGQHRHVRRLFGRGAAIVYEWDHCTSPDRVKNAVKKPWFHNKKAFGLYKSAELHTKHRHPLGFVMWALFALVPATGYAVWSAVEANQAPVELASKLEADRSAQKGSSAGPRVASAAPAAPVEAPAPESRAPQLDVAGGYCAGERCVCWARSGFRHSLGSAACKAWLSAPPVDYWQTQAPRIQSDAPGPAASEPST
jgi:hypothetical protein